MALLSEYKFMIGLESDPLPASLVVTPINDRIISAWEKQESGRAWRKTIKTELNFIKSDYDYIMTLGDCVRLKIDIYRKETGAGDAFAIWFEGILSTSDMKADPARGLVKMTVAPRDGYDCFYRNMKRTVNLLAYARDVKITNEAVVFETVTCQNTAAGGVEYGSHRIDCIPGGAVAGKYKVTQHIEDLFIPGEVVVQTTWQREKWNKATPPPADGSWTEIPGEGFFRFPQITGESIVENYPASYRYYGNPANLLEQQGIDNGRLLKMLLPDMFTAISVDCSRPMKVKSDFFAITNWNDTPTNAAYQRASERLTDLLIFQRSDIMKWNAQENASILEVQVIEFIDTLAEIFNMGWSIIRQGLYDYFVFEHNSYFEGTVQNDFTAISPAKEAIRKHQYYEVSSGDFPKGEKFNMQSGRKNTYFGYTTIDYNSDCIGPKSEFIEHNFPKVSTDFTGLIMNNDPNDNMEGFFIMSCYVVNDFYNMYHDYGLANGPLSWYEIIKYYWLNGRHGSTFTLACPFDTAPESVVSASVLPKRKGAALNIPISHAIEKALNPAFSQKTEIGDGSVEGAEYDTRTRVLTLNMKYQ